MSASDDVPHNLEEVRVFLEKNGLLKNGADLGLIAYEPAFPRRPARRRWHYRVESESQPVCHLIVGMKLDRVKTQTEQFFRMCPTLICRPLAFWEQVDGMGFLCLEHFSGTPLEDLVRDGRCSADEWLRIVRHAVHLMEKSSIPSTPAALQREIEDLVNGLAAFPEFSDVDTKLVRDLVEPLLLKQSTFSPLTTRWTNGDFIGRNILVNLQGEIRLIDYEHSGPTHFWRSDWLRMTQFSQLPQGLNFSQVEEISSVQPPWQSIQFWLHNLSQLGEAAPCEPVDRHVSSVVHELFRAIDSAPIVDGNPQSRSVLLKALAREGSEKSSFSTTPRDERYRQRRLEEDLEIANYRVVSLERELALKKEIIRNRSATNEHAKAETLSLSSRNDHLRTALQHAQAHIDRLLVQNSASAHNNTPTSSTMRQDGSAEEEYSIDQKDGFFAKKGKLVLTGKIKSASPDAKVRVRFDRGNIFDCIVSKKNTSEPSVYFALETYVPAGLHLVTLEYSPDTSRAWIPLCTRSLVAEVGPLLLRLETAIPPTTAEGAFFIRGWCLHSQEKIKSLSVHHGAVASELTYGTDRPDVATSRLGNPQAGHSGFSGSFTIQPGEDDVILAARLESGIVLQETIARRIFVPDTSLLEANDKLSKPLTTDTATLLPYCKLGQPLLFGHEDNIRPFLEFGWHEPEHGMRWAVGPRAGLRFLFKRDDRPSVMKLTVVPLIVAEKAEKQRINLDLPYNTAPQSMELTSAQPQELIFHLGAMDPSTEILTVRFGFPDACRPHDLGLSNDLRVLSLGFVSITFS